MSKRPSEGIGKRIAKYRRLTGLSARELADAAGAGLTRGVIANIESGRKSDITVDQLIALASVLGVPPVALALPIDEPHRFIQVSDSVRVRTYAAVDAFTARDISLFTAERETTSPNGATVVATELLAALHKYAEAVKWLPAAQRMVAEGRATDEQVRELEEQLESGEMRLRQLGADMRVFKIDE